MQNLFLIDIISCSQFRQLLTNENKIDVKFKLEQTYRFELE